MPKESNITIFRTKTLKNIEIDEKIFEIMKPTNVYSLCGDNILSHFLQTSRCACYNF